MSNEKDSGSVAAARRIVGPHIDTELEAWAHEAKVRLVASELVRARNQGAADERQVLVNWMRDPSHVEKAGGIVAEIMDRLAGIIESGAHRDHDG